MANPLDRTAGDPGLTPGRDRVKDRFSVLLSKQVVLCRS